MSGQCESIEEAAYDVRLSVLQKKKRHNKHNISKC